MLQVMSSREHVKEWEICIYFKLLCEICVHMLPIFISILFSSTITEISILILLFIYLFYFFCFINGMERVESLVSVWIEGG